MKLSLNPFSNHTPFTHRNLLAVLALASILPILNAQEVTAGGSDRPADSATGTSRVLTLDPFRVVGGYRDAFGAPGAAAYLGSEELARFDLTDINRALRQVPGVYVREEDGFGLFPNISLRGVDTNRNSKLMILEDGIPMAPAPYSAPAAYYTPNLARMQGLEVLKGSSQIQHGPHTTGGVINYRATRIEEDRTGFAKFSYGSNEDVRAHLYLTETTGTAVGELGYLFEGFQRSNEGFKRVNGVGPAFQGEDDTGFDQQDLRVKFSLVPKGLEDHRFEFSAGRTELEYRSGYIGLTTEDFADDPFEIYAAGREDRFDSLHERLSLKHIWQAGETLRVSTALYRNSFHRDWFKLHDIRDVDTDGDGIPEGQEAGSAGRVGTSLSGALAGSVDGQALEVLKGERAGILRIRSNNRDYDVFGIQTRADATFTTGPVEHALQIGLRYHEDRIRRFQRDDLASQDSEGAWSIARGEPGSGGNREQEAYAWALHLTDRISYGDFAFEPGFRYENIDYSFTAFASDSTNTVTEGPASDTLEVFAPGASLTWSPGPETHAFVGLYKGFSVPGPRAFVRSGVSEETSLSFEVGVRKQWAQGGLRAEVVYFRTDFDDLLVVENVGGSGAGITENVGEALSQGIELTAHADPGQLNDWSFRMPLDLALTFTDATLEGDSRSADPESLFAGGQDGNRIPYVPEFQVNFTAGVESGPWGAYATFTYVSETYSNAAETGAEVNPVTGEPDARFGRIDSYAVVDLSAFYRLGRGVELFATAKNLFEEEYMASRHPHGPRPGAPRLISGGVEWNF